MANVKLPKQIDPIQLADNRKTLKGKLSLAKMDRLKEFLCGVPGNAIVELEFGRDLLNYPFMRGTIKAELDVVCQRCNAPMHLELSINVANSLVRTDEEAEQLPKHYEPMLITGDTMSLSTVIEEEILLSIPIIPKHSMKECQVKSSEFIEFEEEKEKSNPFEILKKLLRE